jgi:hypothetical protein
MLMHFVCFHQQQKLLLNSKKQVAQLTPCLQPINEHCFDSNSFDTVFIPMSAFEIFPCLLPKGVSILCLPASDICMMARNDECDKRRGLYMYISFEV